MPGDTQHLGGFAGRDERLPFMRELILDEADQQLRLGGFAELNFASIADALEITRANIHYHFGSKAELALAATERYTDESLQSMRGILDSYPRDLPTALVAIESAIIERVKSRGARQTCICSQLIRDSTAPAELRDHARSFFEAKHEMLRAATTESVDAEVLKEDVDVERFTTMAMAMLMGLDQQAMVADDPLAFAARARGVVSVWVEPYRASAT